MDLNQDWFVSRDGTTQEGPFNTRQVRLMLGTGQLRGAHLAWSEGMPGWQTLTEIATFRPASSPSPAPALPPLSPLDPAAPLPLYAGFAPASTAVPLAYTAAAPSAHGPYAGFWLRVIAVLIDSIIAGVLQGVIVQIVVFAVALLATGAAPATRGAAAVVLASLASLAATWLYSALMESSSKQATIGKLALGLKVTDIAGRRISFGLATGRFFARMVSGFTLGVGFVMAAFTAQKQALHDLMAGTLVLRTR